MKYSKEIAFKRKQELLQIEASIKQAEETLISDPSASNLEELEKLKNKYDSHFDYIAKGAMALMHDYVRRPNFTTKPRL